MLHDMHIRCQMAINRLGTASLVPVRIRMHSKHKDRIVADVKAMALRNLSDAAQLDGREMPSEKDVSYFETEDMQMCGMPIIYDDSIPERDIRLEVAL